MAAGIKGGRAAWIVGASAWQFLQRVTASSRRARRNCLHTNVRDRAPAPNTGSARGGTRAENPKGRKSRACAAGREQSTPRPPQRGAEHAAATSTSSEHVVNLLAPRGRRNGASIRHDGDILTVCDSVQTCTHTSENAGPRFGLPMHGIWLIHKNCLR